MYVWEGVQYVRQANVLSITIIYITQELKYSTGSTRYYRYPTHLKYHYCQTACYRLSEKTRNVSYPKNMVPFSPTPWHFSTMRSTHFLSEYLITTAKTNSVSTESIPIWLERGKALHCGITDFRLNSGSHSMRIESTLLGYTIYRQDHSTANMVSNCKGHHLMRLMKGSKGFSFKQEALK